MPGQCATCPFGGSDEAENAINLGCVPSLFEVLEIKRNTGHNWGCHGAADDETKPCAGFVGACRELNLDYKTGSHLSYKDWFENGAPA